MSMKSKMRKQFIKDVVEKAVSDEEVAEGLAALSIFPPPAIKSVTFIRPYTVAVVTVAVPGVFIASAVGKAKCNPIDEWSYEEGERIAVARAASCIWKEISKEPGPPNMDWPEDDTGWPDLAEDEIDELISSVLAMDEMGVKAFEV